VTEDREIEHPVIEVPASFLAMPRWWHEGSEWLEALPSLVADQCQRWGLVPDGALRHGSNALVVRVRRGREQLALRLSPPGDDVAREAAALRFWDGGGTVRLLDADPERRALLLEWINPGHSLADHPLAETPAIIGPLLQRLATDAPGDAPSTGAVASADAADWCARWDALGGPTSRRRLGAALGAAAAVSEPATPRLAVNADLHFDQILHAEREPWLVVDPVLMRGDVGYDLGRLLWSRLDELTGDQDVRGYLRALVEAAGLDLERCERLVVVRAMSYLLWGLEHGLTEDPPRCRRLLEIFAQP
jgi:streptomycin 6-kinase